MKKSLLGEEHSEYARSVSRLAALYSDMGKAENAEELYDQVLQIYRTALGEQHPQLSGDWG